MTPKTLRRKLQKKLKHKPYRRCSKCGSRMVCKLSEMDYPTPRLFKVCTNFACSHREELFWSGGGTGRHIPPAEITTQLKTEQSVNQGKGTSCFSSSCAGSSPAPTTFQSVVSW